MKIGIIGGGNMARTLATKWVSAGHEVMVSSREKARAREVAKAIGDGARGGGFRDAAEFGEVLMLAVHWENVFDALAAAGPIDGKVLIDCNNLVDQKEFKLQVGFTDSCAERVAREAPGARVVKAFNTIYRQALEREQPHIDEQVPTLFIAGDDDEAKAIVARLGRDAGLEAIDCGPLEMARLLEPVAGLIIQLGWVRGMAPYIAVNIAHEPVEP